MFQMEDLPSRKLNTAWIENASRMSQTWVQERRSWLEIVGCPCLLKYLKARVMMCLSQYLSKNSYARALIPLQLWSCFRSYLCHEPLVCRYHNALHAHNEGRDWLLDKIMGKQARNSIACKLKMSTLKMPQQAYVSWRSMMNWCYCRCRFWLDCRSVDHSMSTFAAW